MNMNNRSFFIALFATGISFMSLSAGAQLRRLPSVVTDSFNLRFPGATKVTWKDKITVFQADFIFNNATEQAKYTIARAAEHGKSHQTLWRGIAG